MAEADFSNRLTSRAWPRAFRLIWLAAAQQPSSVEGSHHASQPQDCLCITDTNSNDFFLYLCYLYSATVAGSQP